MAFDDRMTAALHGSEGVKEKPLNLVVPSKGNMAIEGVHVANYKFREAAQNALQSAYKNNGMGGLNNPMSGIGSELDKMAYAFFSPTRIFSRSQLETIYVESWACGKFINIPVDDMMIRWRVFESVNEEQAKNMAKAEKKYKVKTKLKKAMKAARLFGTGMLVIVTREAPLTEPLNLDRIRKDDLIQLLCFNRFDASVSMTDRDIYSETYGKPLFYRFTPEGGTMFDVHESRVIRFDGIAPLNESGFTGYEKDWGVSSVVPVLISIFQDATIASNMSHLSGETSLSVLKLQGLREALVGRMQDQDTIPPDQLLSKLNMLKSNYRTLAIDVEDEFERKAVTWGGIHQVIDQFARRLAAAADIPATRFWGQSPVGMNATGDSDAANYSIMVSANQIDMLTDPLLLIDNLIVRSMGMGSEPMEYEFLPLVDVSEKDQAEVAKLKAEAGKIGVETGAIDEDEARSALDGDSVFGELPEGQAPGRVEPGVDPNNLTGSPTGPGTGQGE